MNVEPTNDQLFIARLTRIVLSNLKNEQFGVCEMAEEIGKSRSYIHRRLKFITNESASQFICRIRLEKAKEILLSQDITVSEVAYDIGFSSPSYFIKCFHEYYGVPPGDFLKAGKNETGGIKEVLFRGKHTNSGEKKWFLNRLIWMSLFVLLASGVLLGKYLNKKNHSSGKEKSIAVLPLINTAEDQESLILAEGMMEDVLNRISQIQDLKVKSRTTAKKYKDTELSMPEIGRELGVSYILIGSIIREKGKIRLYIYLVDAEEDNRIWGKQYDCDAMDVFDFISVVSREIAEELEVILSPVEVEQIEKLYTTNTEAYRLYQKGRYFWHRRTKEDNNVSIKYFNQALGRDSSYALAYAGLADAYYVGAWWGWLDVKEAVEKAKLFADRALVLDRSLAEPHATLGIIAFWFDCNCKLAEKELKKAMELNPQNAITHMYYAEYLDVINRAEEARKHINIAIDLNPNFEMNYWMSALFYYNAENYEMSIVEIEKLLELDSSLKGQYWFIFVSNLKLGRDSLALNALLELPMLYKPEINFRDSLFGIYKEAGMDAILTWILNKDLSKTQGLDPMSRAYLYLLAKQPEKAIDILDKTYVKGVSKYQRINSHPDFKPFRNDPRFIALLKEMDLPLE